MQTFNIKEDFPTVEEAEGRLTRILQQAQIAAKPIKIIHGYGASGVGGAIKQRVHAILSSWHRRGIVKAFIPGEAVGGFLGFANEIQKYRSILKDDSDFKKRNDGVTFVFFK